MFKLFKHKDSESGVAAIEFALVLPILILVFIGMAIFSNYIMVSRKIDLAANDIAAIIAKEGRIAERRVTTRSACAPLNGATYTEYVGGKSYLDDDDGLIKSLLPVLIYPLNYRKSNNTTIPITFDYQVLMGGIPLWNKIYPPSGAAPGGIDTNAIVVMWEQRSGKDFRPTTTGNELSFNDISSEILFKAENQGQAFLGFAIDYPYDQGNGYYASLLGGLELVGMKFMSDANFGPLGEDFSITRAAAYPVRPSNINSAGNLIPYNDLNICTDCNIRRSNSVAPPCKAGCTNFQFDTNVSGCAFD